ncbi:MAG: 4-hydroxy-tetrahydrodipicolinate reductase [Bacteroidetes bacterium]|nr:4-hydroxy-tetrahydrodipicolinate reductase [Bacteroidota bacterium]
MKIALLGYGKMGQEIHKLAEKRGHEIVLIIDNDEEWQDKGAQLKEADVAIEFTTPESAVDNILHCFDADIPVVVGTTGWIEDIESIRKTAVEQNKGLFFSPNFSIGVNLFFDLNRYLASLMAKWENYEISIEETHHIHKLDAPSGTAIVLANDIIRYNERKEKWVKELQENPDEVGIKSYRSEDVPGTHIIRYESEMDAIVITHTAKSRKGFALGALLAAEWIKGKHGFFEMRDLLNSQKSTP